MEVSFCVTRKSSTEAPALSVTGRERGQFAIEQRAGAIQFCSLSGPSTRFISKGMFVNYCKGSRI
jgi:hypothetical protein